MPGKRKTRPEEVRAADQGQLASHSGPLEQVLSIEDSTNPASVDYRSENPASEPVSTEKEFGESIEDHPYPHQGVMVWFTKSQIEASPLTPTEIAERSGVSASQIYRFIKGERSLTLESADKILPVVGRSLVDALLQSQEDPSSPERFLGNMEHEKEQLRRRLDNWEKGSFAEVKNILEDVGTLAAKIRKVIEEL